MLVLGTALYPWSGSELIPVKGPMRNANFVVLPIFAELSRARHSHEYWTSWVIVTTQSLDSLKLNTCRRMHDT